MKTLEDRLDATCRIPDAERRRLIAAVSGDEPVTDVGKPENEPCVAGSATRKWSRSYVRALREQDFVARSNDRPARVAWIAFAARFIRMLMPRRRQTIRNCVGIIVDQPILDLIGITPETDLDLTTDGTSLVITPQVWPEAGRRRPAKVEARMLKKDAGTFRKLAW